MSGTIESSNPPADAASARFAGFALPTSNTTYTPNQFFDVCLPHSSRGCVRLVSRMIRKTLGWCDAEGRPQQEQIRLSYADLEAAGISRGMIKSAVTEAIESNFIRCVREARPKSAGEPAVSALFELNWDESGEYIKDPKRFRGFFGGDGNRTYIPNQFFDHVIPREPLAVVKVVGSVIRFSIGFVNKWGHRRTHASLSYTDLQRYSKVRNRQNLGDALRFAIDANYLHVVDKGYFDPNGGVESRTATYAVKWRTEATDDPNSMKNVPGAEPFNNQSENQTGIGSKNSPVDQFKNRTGLQIKQTKKTSKQQAAVFTRKERDATGADAVELLQHEGFDRTTAEKLAGTHAIERIVRQIEWIDQRGVRRNRVGMLRKAIEQDWSKPMAGKLRRLNAQDPNTHPLAEARDALAKRFSSFSSS